MPVMQEDKTTFTTWNNALNEIYLAYSERTSKLRPEGERNSL